MKNNPIGHLILVWGAVLSVIMMLCQTGIALIDYDLGVSLNLLQPVERFTEVGVAFTKGFGVVDMLVYAPLLIGGAIGIVKRAPWGIIPITGALAITIYWPVMSIASYCFLKDVPGFSYPLSNLLIVVVPSFLWGLWGCGMFGGTRGYFKMSLTAPCEGLE